MVIIVIALALAGVLLLGQLMRRTLDPDCECGYPYSEHDHLSHRFREAG